MGEKGRLWLNNGSCVRLKPEYRNHVWSYDFVHCRTDDGKAFRTLNIFDEYSRECLAIRVERKLNSTDVIDVLTDLFILRGAPSFIRSDNGPEFVAQVVRDWIAAVGAKTAYMAQLARACIFGRYEEHTMNMKTVAIRCTLQELKRCGWGG